MIDTKFIKFIILISSIFLSIFIAEAYDNIYVHQMINGNAAQQSGNLQSTFKSLGVKDIFDYVNGQQIWKWFYEGARLEDETHCRSRNHFHDPLKTWENAGLNNSILNTICSTYYQESYSVDSSIIWAQKPTNNLYSWVKAREYYYNALTNNDKDLREENLAKTFRSVGQVMHLVADSSVPEHVRNDVHILPQETPKEWLAFSGITVGTPTYETWTKEHYDRLNYSGINNNQSFLNEAVYNTSAPIPITALWDQDKYQGSQPSNWIPYSGQMVGLSEYTNANYFSKDTTLYSGIFNTYPHPSLNDTNFSDIKLSDLETIDAEDGAIDRRIYISKIIGEPIKHLAAISYLHSDLLNLNIYTTTNYRLFFLDDKCFEEYASHLVPMAVGYNTALLDYFFRGTLEISAPDSYVYSITDGSQTPYSDSYGNLHQQFSHIKAKVKNTTQNEYIQSGIIQAVARYKVVSNYMPDLSNYPPDGTVMYDIPYSYSVSLPKTLISEEMASMNAYPTEFTFDFTNNPIPAGITDFYLYVIFKGTLGNEPDNAIAVGMKDLMEPTHQVFWNLTDMFSLYYHLYTSEQIKADSNLASLVDYDHDEVFNEIDIGEPYIEPHDKTLKVAYFGTYPPQQDVTPLANVQLPSGRHIRLLLLLDRQENNYLRLMWSDNVYNKESYYDFSFSGALSQEVDGIFKYTFATSFRSWLDSDGITKIPFWQHFSQGVLNCEPLTADHECTYLQEESIPADPTPHQVEISFP